MTKEDFNSGKAFKYVGYAWKTIGTGENKKTHVFGVLANKPLRFDQPSNSVVIIRDKTVPDDVWPVQKTDDQSVYVLKPRYGRICIDFNECEIIK